MEDAGDSTDPKRERNRILARETRMRKKNMLTSLKDQVSQLVKDNERLKTIIQTKLDKKLASKILMECCGSLPDVVATMSNKATALLTREDYGLIAAIRAAQRAFCITDPHLADNPIVFASQGFLELTGYTSDQVISRNCRFLQGPGTDLRSVEILADGIRKGIDTSVPLLNYKADGTPFWNQIYVAALRDSNNVIVNYVGVQCEVTPLIWLCIPPLLTCYYRFPNLQEMPMAT